MQIPVYSLNGKELESWNVATKSFGAENEILLAQAVRIYTSNSHQKTSKVKTRGEVAGSTRKIYRQKGTGNARHGAKYAPIFVGGGIAHGPTGLRPDNLILPKAMRRSALAAAMQLKLSDKAITGISGLKNFTGKTSDAAKLLTVTTAHPSKSVLVVTASRANSLYHSLRNLQGVSMKRASLVNAYDLVATEHLLITKQALEVITKRTHKPAKVQTP